jgi:SSS family solute:Na+ symporter
VLGWNLNFSIWVSSITVAIYVALGGLRSAIFNEVLQFLLIWLGALLVPILGLIEVGGWTNLKADILKRLGSSEYVHMWAGLGHFTTNPMGVHWTGIVFGLGFVISFGYWTTDFLVVQRVLSADSIRSARMAPILGAAFKMAVPFIVILPGLLAISVLPFKLYPESLTVGTALHSYNEVLPLLLVRYLGPGLLGLGVTALIAGFMSGMAGNVSAFSTVWTYDLYGAFINKKATDQHYVAMGRWSTLVGVLISVGTAYLVQHAASIMDYVQQLFSFFIAPLFGVVILGMLWRRPTKAGGFWGLLCGTITAISLWLWVKEDPHALRYVALSPDAKDMAENLYRALWTWIVTVVVTVVVSLFTEAKPVKELEGLVYGVVPLPDEHDDHWYQKPIIWACIVGVGFVVLNIIFW